MGIVMLSSSSASPGTKTIRDMHEGGKLVNRIEDAEGRPPREVSKATPRNL